MTTEEIDETPIPDAIPETYPDTIVGSLMRQRDEARANANAARAECERYAGFATDADVRADGLQSAIDAMGGDQPMIPQTSA